MLSRCAFALADLNIFVSRSWQFYRSKHQRHSLVNSDQTVRLRLACGMNNGKKMRIMFACASLSFTLHAQVYLCLRSYQKCGRQKEGILLDLIDFSVHDEFKHSSIFGVCALLFIY